MRRRGEAACDYAKHVRTSTSSVNFTSAGKDTSNSIWYQLTNMTSSEAKEKGATSLYSAQVLITQSSCTLVWVIDSGTCHHFCNDKYHLQNLINSNLEITMGDDYFIKSISKGTMSLRQLSIEVYFVPQFHVSLLSVSQYAKDRYQTTFTDNLYNISKGRKCILRTRETDSLYQINMLLRALVMTR
jgi:hypothetical protein